MYDASDEPLPDSKRSWRAVTKVTPEIAAFALRSNRLLMLLRRLCYLATLMSCSNVAGLHVPAHIDFRR